VVVEGGELVNAGSGFPAEDGVRLACAEEGFIGEPVKFADAGLGFGPEWDSRAVGWRAGDGHFIAGQIDFRRMAGARKTRRPPEKEGNYLRVPLW
jgi:hypothetical protein